MKMENKWKMTVTVMTVILLAQDASASIELIVKSNHASYNGERAISNSLVDRMLYAVIDALH